MFRDFAVRVRSLFHRRTVEAELDEELRFHLERQVEKYKSLGASPVEAQRRAALDLGGLEQTKEQHRDARGIGFVETTWRDVRYGWRSLRQSPGFSAVVIATLALGIGANTAIFSIVDAVLLRSLPVKDPQQLVVLKWSALHSPQHFSSSSYGDCERVENRTGGPDAGCSLSYPTFDAIRSRTDLFAGVAAFAGPSEIIVGGASLVGVAQGQLVSGNYFNVLGVRPALGRTLQTSDDRPGAAPAVMLDFGYWQRVFGRAPDVVGKTVRLNNVVFTIAGVADKSFTRLTPGRSIDLWIALHQAEPLGISWPRGWNERAFWLTVLGRLQPGVSRRQAQEAASRLFENAALHGQSPVWKRADEPTLLLEPAQSGLAGFRSRLREPLQLLVAAVGLVLVIACANVAGLLLARGAAREREMAVRVALGAGRGRLIRQLLTESLLLSFAGAVLGALLAYSGAKGLASFFAKGSYTPVTIELAPTLPILFFAIGIAMITGVGSGLAPALQGSRADVNSDLKGRRLRTGSALVLLQVALSVVVLTGAGLLLRSLENLRHVNAGFDTNNLVLFSVRPSLAGYTAENARRLYENLQSQLAAQPGVDSVSYSSSALLDGSISKEGIHIEGQMTKESKETQILSVGPAFLATMKMRLLAGRMLTQDDMRPERHTAMVNQEFVQRFVGAGKSAIGLHFGGEDASAPKWEIAGVVSSAKYADLRAAMGPTAYVPLQSSLGATFAVRSTMPLEVSSAAIREQVKRLDKSLPVIEMRTQMDSIDRILFNERLLVRLFGLFGLLGLALAALGLYGLLAYDIARRTREIGIRAALGAQRADTLALILRRVAALIAAGALAGVTAAIFVSRLLGSLLYGVRPTDPLTLVVTVGILIAGALAACLLPARRALAIEPAVALWHE